MGLKKLLSRWSKSEDDRAVERAQEETRMTPYERDVDQEGYEARKADAHLKTNFASEEALETLEADDEI